MREKAFWLLLINSNNRSDGISSTMQGKTNLGMTFIEAFGLQWQI